LGSLGVNCKRFETDRTAPVKHAETSLDEGPLDPAIEIPFDHRHPLLPAPIWLAWTCIISHFVQTHRMTNSQRMATVRTCFLRWLASHPQNSAPQQSDAACDESETPILRESILIRDEFYCGRRFHGHTHNAVWFIEEDELKVYRNSGELECVLSSEQIDAGSAPLPQDAGSPDVIKLPMPASDVHSEGEIRRAA
jgi:hypothetical protein